MGAKIIDKPFQSEKGLQQKTMCQDQQNMFKTFKKQNNHESRSFRKLSKSNDNSQQILSFCDEQKSQNVSKTLNVFFNCNKVKFRCRLSGYSLFFLWCGAPTISGHDLVYTCSNNRHLHQAIMHLQIIHVRWFKLLCLVHCLKALFEKATAPSRRKQYPDIKKHSAQPL